MLLEQTGLSISNSYFRRFRQCLLTNIGNYYQLDYSRRPTTAAVVQWPTPAAVVQCLGRRLDVFLGNSNSVSFGDSWGKQVLGYISRAFGALSSQLNEDIGKKNDLASN